MSCHYNDDCLSAVTGLPIPACPNPVQAAVEPSPAGQFAPVLLCFEHVGYHVSDHAFHLGNDWNVTPASELWCSYCRQRSFRTDSEFCSEACELEATA